MENKEEGVLHQLENRFQRKQAVKKFVEGKKGTVFEKSQILNDLAKYLSKGNYAQALLSFKKQLQEYQIAIKTKKKSEMQG